MPHRFLPAAIAAGLLLAPASAALPTAKVWRNPSNTVHIRSHSCGAQAMCGTVVWASEKAKADAARGGTPDLVGTQLFRNFRLIRPGMWKGSVFVPDINKTFSGTVTLVGTDRLVGRGCLALGIGCKSQTWTRIE